MTRSVTRNINKGMRLVSSKSRGTPPIGAEMRKLSFRGAIVNALHSRANAKHRIHNFFSKHNKNQ